MDATGNVRVRVAVADDTPERCVACGSGGRPGGRSRGWTRRLSQAYECANTLPFAVKHPMTVQGVLVPLTVTVPAPRYGTRDSMCTFFPGIGDTLHVKRAVFPVNGPVVGVARDAMWHAQNFNVLTTPFSRIDNTAPFPSSSGQNGRFAKAGFIA